MQELVQLQKHKEEFDAQEIRILSVLLEHEQAKRMKKAANPEFDITVDEGGQLVDLLGIWHMGGNPFQGTDLPQVGSFLFDSSGKVIWLKVGENYRVRPHPTESLDAARSYFSANVAP